MPDELRVLIPSRRLAMLAVAFFCAAVAAAGPADKPRRDRTRSKPAAKPATQPVEPVVEAAPGSILAERRRLNRIPRSQRTVDEIAALAGIDFILAVANADGVRAAALIEVVGYQQLPEGELLLEDPPRPVDPNTLAARIATRARIPVGDLPVETIEVRPRGNLSEFPAVGSWMTAEDRAFVVRALDEGLAGWISKDACLVIRVRADRPTIMGGTFFDVLPASVPVLVPPAPAATPTIPTASPAVAPLPQPPIGPPPLPPPTTQPAPPRAVAPSTTQPVRARPVTPPAPTQPVRQRPATPPATERAAQPTTRPPSPTPAPPPADEGPPEEDK